MSSRNARLGIILMIATTVLFAIQDGISRHLATTYNTLMIVMIRYMFFASFALLWGMTQPGGVRGVAQSGQLRLQILRGLILVLEIVVAIQSFVLLGLVESLAIFGCFPLIVAALSGPMLGESVGWRRWSAIIIGFIGILIILRPGLRVFEPEAVLPLISAVLFALYQILTRMVSRTDGPRTSFFWTGIAGLAGILLIGPFYTEPMAPSDWGLMFTLAGLAITGHFCLIAALDAAEASVVQPLTYLHLVFASAIGVVVFGDTVDIWIVVGAGIVVASGVFTLLRSGRASKSLADQNSAH